MTIWSRRRMRLMTGYEDFGFIADRRVLAQLNTQTAIYTSGECQPLLDCANVLSFVFLSDYVGQLIVYVETKSQNRVPGRTCGCIAVIYPTYVLYSRNLSSSISLIISSSRRQIATAISPSSFLGIKYTRLSQASNIGRRTATALPKSSPKSRS